MPSTLSTAIIKLQVRPAEPFLPGLDPLLCRSSVPLGRVRCHLGPASTCNPVQPLCPCAPALLKGRPWGSCGLVYFLRELMLLVSPCCMRPPLQLDGSGWSPKSWQWALSPGSQHVWWGVASSQLMEPPGSDFRELALPVTQAGWGG